MSLVPHIGEDVAGRHGDRMPGFFCVALLCLGFLCAVGDADYSGSLTYSRNDSEDINATESWEDVKTTISWTVSEPENGVIHYQYVFTHPDTSGSTSHIIWELTPGATESDIFNISIVSSGGDEDDIRSEVHVHDGGGSQPNPNMPEDMFGVKLEGFGDGATHTIDFDSTREPVWGDFYAKGGAGGQLNTAWNAGFTNPDGDLNTQDDLDPTAAPQNGSIEDHILVPNGYVPEPSIGALSLLSLLLLVTARRPTERRQRHG